MSEYQTGTYRKGKQVRVAETAADAVQARFDGFTLDDENAVEEVEVDTTADGAAVGTARPDEVETPRRAVPDFQPEQPTEDERALMDEAADAPVATNRARRK